VLLLAVLWCVYFFFSSRRRHTRSKRDWSSDVCSSDLVGEAGYGPAAQALLAEFFQGKRRAFALGIYSVGMAFGGVLGIWLGGVLAERYGWRAAFVALGVPGFLLALFASRLREPRRQAPPTIRATVKSWYARGRVGAHEALRLGAPLDRKS